MIYALYDPTLSPAPVRYVGFTSKSVKRRLTEHIAEAKAGQSSHRLRWIASLLKRGVKPAATVLEAVSAENWQERERFWISQFESGQLTNATAGGDGLVNPSHEVRAAIAAKVSAGLRGNQRRKGVPHDDETRQRISASVKASEAHAAASSDKRGKPGRPLSDAAREKIRAAKLGVKRAPFSPEHIEKLRQASSGRKHSDESKTKISASQVGNQRAKGMVMTAAAKDAIRASRTGSRFINNGKQTRVLKAGEPFPDGWALGRIKKESR